MHPATKAYRDRKWKLYRQKPRSRLPDPVKYEARRSFARVRPRVLGKFVSSMVDPRAFWQKTPLDADLPLFEWPESFKDFTLDLPLTSTGYVSSDCMEEIDDCIGMMQ